MMFAIVASVKWNAAPEAQCQSYIYEDGLKSGPDL